MIIGKSVSAGLVSLKGADLTVAKYIGRLDNATEADDIRKLLVDKGVDVISIDQIKVNHDRFKSFKLVIKKSHLSIVEDAELWPTGVVVGRFWTAKPANSSDQNGSNG